MAGNVRVVGVVVVFAVQITAYRALGTDHGTHNRFAGLQYILALPHMLRRGVLFYLSGQVLQWHDGCAG
jgi:hypothetical protein